MMQNKKKIIGITGGIGCGKSVVMDILEQEYKAYVILSDLVGHDLMKPGAVNYNGIVAAFGTDILLENGEIDRKKLGSIVFSDKEKLQILNGITHPNIFKETQRRIKEAVENPIYDMVCLESALLLETEFVDYCTEVWYIYADKEVRIERLIAGRGYTREYCETVMAKQKNEDLYREKSDVVINNSGSVEETRQEVKRIVLSK